MTYLIIIIALILIFDIIWDIIKYQQFKKKLKPGLQIHTIVYDMCNANDKGTLFVVTIERTDNEYVYGHFSDGSIFVRSKYMIYDENWKFNEI